MTKKFVVMHTGKPYAGSIPADAWQVLSKHTTAAAAAKRIKKETAHLSSGQWDDHYKVICPDGSEKSYRDLYWELQADGTLPF